MRCAWMLAALALTLIGTTAVADEKHHPAPGAPAPSAQPSVGQPSPGMMPGGMKHGSMGMMMMHRAENAAALVAPRRLEGRIAYLRAEIAPTAAQEAAFGAVADALRAAERPAKGGAAHEHGVAGGGASFADRLAAEEHAAAARLKSVQALRAAFAQLDATLSAEQRATATELLPLLFPNVL